MDISKRRRIQPPSPNKNTNKAKNTNKPNNTQNSIRQFSVREKATSKTTVIPVTPQINWNIADLILIIPNVLATNKTVIPENTSRITMLNATQPSSIRPTHARAYAVNPRD
jgi:hypothetical protein